MRVSRGTLNLPSLLPQRILPFDHPLGTTNPDGSITIDKNWWLLLYNMSLNSIGTAGISNTGAQVLDSVELDSSTADIPGVRARADLAAEFAMDTPLNPTTSDLPDIYKALTLAQDPLLQDGRALAQPTSSISVGGSPFTYTALFWGSVAVTGGTVSAISVIRAGVTVATGLTQGLIPAARYDQIVVTYTGVPTMTFIPGSSQ